MAVSSDNERISKLGTRKKISKPVNVNLGTENSAKQPGSDPKGKKYILAAHLGIETKAWSFCVPSIALLA